MGPAPDTHIHGILTGEIDIAHRVRQRSGVSALLLLRLFVLRSPLFQTGPLLFLCKAMLQLDISELSFNPFFLSLPTRSPRVSGLELSFSWTIDSSARFDAFCCLLAVVRDHCVLVEGSSVGSFFLISHWEMLVESWKGRRVVAICI